MDSVFQNSKEASVLEQSKLGEGEGMREGIEVSFTGQNFPGHWEDLGFHFDLSSHCRILHRGVSGVI